MAINPREEALKWLKQSEDLEFAPNIGPCGDSTDVHWRDKNFELLVNFSEEGVSYYGDNYGKKTVKGFSGYPFFAYTPEGLINLLVL